MDNRVDEYLIWMVIMDKIRSLTGWLTVLAIMGLVGIVKVWLWLYVFGMIEY